MDATTFKRKSLSSFLIALLSTIEDESYAVIKLSSKKVKELELALVVSNLVISQNFYEMSWNFVFKFGLSNSKLDANKYYLICSEENTSIFQEIISLSNLETTISQVSNQIVILLDGIELSDKFKEFSALKGIAYQLVDWKLSNPELSDTERLSVVLESLKNKYK